jgi:hypothetical protein
MIDEGHIEFHPLVKRDVASTTDLPKAGNAGYDAESAADAAVDGIRMRPSNRNSLSL